MNKQLITENLKIINENIEKACFKSNRKKEDIRLLAVTKTIDTQTINEAKALGLNYFGENKVQELLSKYEHIENAKWHFIGNLQTNKVKYIIDKVELIHSVNSIKLMEEIDKRAKNIGKKMPILLEINIANEPTKKGISLEEIEPMLENVAKYDNILLNGLMCVAPFVEKEEENAKYFRKMRNLFVDIRQKNTHNIDMKYLSMGMTNDYSIAIEEGANIIRIGTGIFGKRNN